MKRIAVFGGTFNPIHKGHINLCLECARHFHFDRILLIPTNVPPHKHAQNLASNQDRLEMCRLASQEEPLFLVSDLEMRLQGVSYTIRTLEELEREYPGAELYLIIGSDMLFMFHQWYRYEEILQKAHLIAGARAPSEYDRMAAYVKEYLTSSERVHIIHIHVFEASSTAVRETIQNDGEAPSALDERVSRYIREHGLYRKEETR